MTCVRDRWEYRYKGRKKYEIEHEIEYEIKHEIDTKSDTKSNRASDRIRSNYQSKCSIKTLKMLYRGLVCCVISSQLMAMSRSPFVYIG